ncbi:unnamed protein product [Sphagnum jensenii]|uniref:Uncharacterized protein n=1 Tax=Sphagnum jensenii TaxID=128206 RepID=A0ABP1BSC1_9BRYO
MDDAILPMPLVLYHLQHVVPLLDKVQKLVLCSVVSGQNAGWLVCFEVLEDTRPNFFCVKFQGYSSNGLLPLPQMCHHIVAGHGYHMGSLCIIPEDTSTTLFPQIHLRCAIMQLCSSNSLSSQLGVALGTDGGNCHVLYLAWHHSFVHRPRKLTMASKKESDTMTMWLWHTMGKHLMKELWSILFTYNHVDML